MTVEVVTRQSVELEKYYVIRGIHINGNGKKEVIVEKEIEKDPTVLTVNEEMARIMLEHPMVAFCVIEKCYRLKG